MTDNKELPELKPCPFCGSTQLVACLPVYCMECDSEGPSGSTMDECHEAWNKRPTEKIAKALGALQAITTLAVEDAKPTR